MKNYEEAVEAIAIMNGRMREWEYLEGSNDLTPRDFGAGVVAEIFEVEREIVEADLEKELLIHFPSQKRFRT